MGLWIQNVGVRAAELPSPVRALAAKDSYGLPAPFEPGWSWTSLRDGDFLDSDQLDDLAAQAAGENGGPALAFSIHDSDSAYLVGADAGGIGFRVVVNPEAMDGLVGYEAGAAAASAAGWAAEHAPASPTAAELADALARHYVFAEAGLDVVLARMGFLPPDAGEGADVLAEDELAEDEEDREEEAAPSADEAARLRDVVPLTPRAGAEEHPLPATRWYAPLDDRSPTRWWIVAWAEERSIATIMGFDEDDPAVREELARHGLGWEWRTFGCACADGEPVLALADAFGSREDLAGYLAMPELGIRLAEWRTVPDEVPCTLAATAEWVVAQPR